LGFSLNLFFTFFVTIQQADFFLPYKAYKKHIRPQWKNLYVSYMPYMVQKFPW